MNNQLNVASPLVGDARRVPTDKRGLSGPPKDGVPRVPARRDPPVLALLVLAVLQSGCQLMVNPFHDELAGPQAMTTPSV